MGRAAGIILAVVALGWCWQSNALSSFAQAHANGTEEQRIGKLIKELGHEDFSIRENAQRELLKIGDPAATALDAAAGATDIEVSRRAKVILRELGKRSLDKEVEKVTWKVVRDRIRQHAEGKEWETPGFEDGLLEKALQKLVDQANAAAGDARVKLPTTFAQCQPRGQDGDRRRDLLGENLLLVGKGNLDVGRATRSIILADGSVSIGYATDCIVIARGAVTVSHGGGNLIVAGLFIDVAHDGSRLRPGGEAAEGASSLLISGGDLNISHAQRAVCYAPVSIDISHGSGCVFLNRTPLQIKPDQGTAAPDARLLFTPLAPENAIQDKLRITQVVCRDSRAENLAVIEHNGIELVVRPGRELKDNLGNPLPGVDGWKLEFIAEQRAIFSNGKDDAMFIVTRRQ